MCSIEIFFYKHKFLYPAKIFLFIIFTYLLFYSYLFIASFVIDYYFAKKFALLLLFEIHFQNSYVIQSNGIELYARPK